MKRNEQREQAFILLFEYLFLPQDDLVAIYDENIGTVSDYAKELYTGGLTPRHSTQHAVNKAGVFLTAVLLCQLHSLIDRHAVRQIVHKLHFVERQTQNSQAHLG